MLYGYLSSAILTKLSLRSSQILWNFADIMDMMDDGWWRRFSRIESRESRLEVEVEIEIEMEVEERGRIRVRVVYASLRVTLCLDFLTFLFQHLVHRGIPLVL